MTNINDGGPAFPVLRQELYNGDFVGPDSGMTLRDWFAGMAMQSLLRLGSKPAKLSKSSDYDPDQPFYFGNWDKDTSAPGATGVEMLADHAYLVADAMLNRRETP